MFYYNCVENVSFSDQYLRSDALDGHSKARMFSCGIPVIMFLYKLEYALNI
jgi:hypothetical protein